ncbi:MAG: right-handed parallel beta-helix repeat-containing protein [Abditibacteriota bacterium]|nr:right-handed parallel beta-helix repeat-containing protein [Abditibacteriota bacterium]
MKKKWLAGWFIPAALLLGVCIWQSGCDAAKAAGLLRSASGNSPKEPPFATLACSEGDDITQALQDLLKERRRVLIPRGTYRISGPVRVPSDTVIKGEAGTVLVVGEYEKTEGVFGAPLVFPGAPSRYVFEVAGKIVSKGAPPEMCSDVTISDLSFVSGKPGFIAAVAGLSVKNLTIENVNTVGMRIAYISYAGRLRDGILRKFDLTDIRSDAYLNDGVRIAGCSADCDNTSYGSGAGIHIEYSRNIAIENCRVENCGTGIILTGWDQNALEGSKKDVLSAGDNAGSFVTLKNGSVTGCAVHKAENDGISCVCCDDITVKNCQADNCRMGYGIGFTGSGEYTAEGCETVDCAINYSVVQHYAGRVRLAGCSSLFADRSVKVGGSHLLICYPTAISSESEVIIEKCVFDSNTRGHTGAGIGCPPKNTLVRNNRFVNTDLVIQGSNAAHDYPEKNITVDDNTFEIDSRVDRLRAPSYGLKIESRRGYSISVCNNVFKGKLTPWGILIEDRSPEGGGKAHIDGNDISGYGVPIFIGAEKSFSVTGGDFKGKTEIFTRPDA